MSLRIAGKLTAVFFALLMSAQVLHAEVAGLTQQEKDYIERTGAISIGIVADDEPYSYMAHGQYSGFSYDILREISKMTGLKFNFRMGNWSEIYTSFLRGNLDAIDAISYTEERSGMMFFTDPYSIRKTVIFSTVENPVASLSEGKSVRVGVIRDIYYQKMLEDMPNAEVVEYRSYSELMKSLAFGWIDCVVASEFTGLYISRKLSLSNIIVSGPAGVDGISEEDFRLAVLKDRPILAGILAKAVDALPQSKKDEIAAKWLNSSKGLDIRAEDSSFTEGEKAFISKRPVVSVGILADYEPFSFYSGDDVHGYTRSLLDLIGSYSGLRFSFIVGDWHTLLADFKSGKLDCIADISYTDERATYTLYTKEYYKIPNVVFTRDDFGVYKDIFSLKGKRVGIAKDVFFGGDIDELYGDSVTEFDSNEDMMRALAFGRVDAVATTLHTGNNTVRRLGLINIRIAGDLNINGVGMEDLRFGVRPDLPELRSVLNKSMDAVSMEEIQFIEELWLTSKQLSQIAKTVPLTTSEVKYIKDKQSVTLCMPADTMPYVRTDKTGRHEGIIPDIANLLQQRTGLQILHKGTAGDADSFDLLENGGCDIAVVGSLAGRERVIFTSPVFTAPNVIATSVDEPFIENIRSLKDKEVCAVDASPAAEYLGQSDGVRLKMVKNAESGLAMLRSGGIYGFAGDMHSIGYQIQQKRAADIKISMRLAEDSTYAIAATEGNPILFHIIQKAVSGIREKDRTEVTNRWMSVRFEQSVNYGILWKVVAVFLIVTGAVVYWSGKLRSLNRKLNEANEKLKEMSDKDELTGLFNRRYLMRQAENALGICSRNDIVFSAAMLDIDHFKNVNDTYGHVIGDECLKIFADILSEYFMRQTDILARYGGEEFMVCSPGDTGDMMVQRLEELRCHLEGMELSFGVASFSITVSAGVYSKVPDEHEDLEDFIKKADAALYEAKRSGRNKVVHITI